MPNHDLVAVWEACRSEFEARDVDATTDTMVTDASVNRPDIEMSSPRLRQIRLPTKNGRQFHPFMRHSEFTCVYGVLTRIEACIPALRRYAAALLRNRQDADDLVQDSLVPLVLDLAVNL